MSSEDNEFHRAGVDSGATGEQPVAERDREAMPVDDEEPPRLAFPVVGVGASAGGLEAFSEFLGAMRADSGMAFVLILHLPPDRTSMLVEVVSKWTTMPVLQVEDGLVVQPDHLYVIRPGRVLTIEKGVLRLGPELEGPRAANRPVDDFFKSLAQEQRERAIGIVLSGMGSNGTAGAQAIKAVGGLCVAQDPESCQFSSMPRHLIDQGCADYILRPADMPDVLLGYAMHPYASGLREDDAGGALRREQHHVREILALLRSRTRQDFNGYKKPTILRRIQRRMGLARMTSMGDYAKLLRQTPNELSALADDLLIHVTGFFRDPAAWEALRARVIVPLVASRDVDAEVRAWVTACASGEEAYTLAMLLVEEADRVGKRLDIKVFATDMADRTLGHARAGVYPGGIEAEITPERLARFFERDDAVYRVRQELRERLVFAPQNVLRDPPFSRLDIITCRNLLIYLEPAQQQRLLGLLHFGLREGGTLFLGTSDTVGGAEDMFEPVDKTARLFRRVGPTRHGNIDFPAPQAVLEARGAALGHGVTERVRDRPRITVVQRTQHTLLERHTPAAVTVDRDHRIVYYHGDTYPFFQQPAGEPSRDLLMLVRDGLRGAVRAALHGAAAANAKKTVQEGWLETEPGVRVRTAISASPLIGGAERETAPADYFVVTFEQRERARPGGELPGVSTEMSEELRHVRDELQSTVEELQASNEELRASHEEVVSMNEELQSSNEELETSKEEMQSLNEELTTVNSQLRAKMEEHQAASSDLNSLLTSTDIAVLFLDPHFRIRRFTPPVRQLLDVITADVGRPLSALARKFDDPELLTDAEAVLERLLPAEREIAAADGRWFLRRITPYRTADNRIDGVVITFVDVTARRLAQASLFQSEEQFRRAIEEAPIPVIMQAEDGQVLQVSRTWTVLTGYALADVPTADAWLTRAYGPGAEAVRAHTQELFKGDRETLDVEFMLTTRGGEHRHWSFSASAPGTLADGRKFLVGMAVDVTDRKRAEDDLRASESKYRRLFENMIEGFALAEMIWDEDGNPADWRYLEVNQAWAQTGVPVSQTVGRTAREVNPSIEPGWIETYGRVVKTGRPASYEAYAAGFGKWFETFAFKHSENCFALLFRDVTDRNRAVEALRASEERLQRAMRIGTVGVLFFNLDGTVVHANETFCRYSGFTLDELRATKDWLAFTPREFRAVTDQAARELGEQGETAPYEKQMIRKDGSRWWGLFAPTRLSGAGRGAECVEFIIDITRQKQWQQSLRESEERLRLVVEGARDFAMLLLDADVTIIGWNIGAERLLGYTEAEAIGQPGAIIFTPEDQALGGPDQERLQAAETGRATDERWHIRKDGSRFWGSGVLTALRNADGSVRGFVKVLRDESGRKQLEDAKKALLDAAELANRHKDEFLATLSHELRTPLSAILIWSKMLGPDSDAQALTEGLAAIRNSADAQRRLIEDLLDTSRITTGNLRLEMKPTPLASVVQGAVESVQPAAQAKGVNIVQGVAPGVGTVQVDPVRMKQVLWNLVSNAVKFTPAGGVVEVSVRRLEGHVEMQVTDTGKGIAADFLPHVFEPFRQADATTTRRYGGLGLGLAICKKLVEQHGGTIAAMSDGPGRGSTFTVTLPLPSLPAVLAPLGAAASSAEERAALAGLRVLLVEDDAETRNALAAVLLQAGAIVYAMGSAREAIEAYRESRVDLVVSDIGMPLEDGYSLIRKVRSFEAETSKKRVPALALTAFVAKEDQRKADAAGFDRHLGKPVEPQQLLSTLKSMVSAS